jgi:hypothetical protein
MTAVTSWTGIEGVVQVAGSPVAFVKFDLNVERSVASAQVANHYSAINRPGTVKVTGSIRQILTDGNMFAKLISSTPTTGSVETLLAATGVLDASDTWTPFTDASIATPSRIRLTLATNNLTVGGTATIIGTGANDEYQEETLVVPATMLIAETLTTTKTFKTADGIFIRDVDSASDLGTFAVASIAGDATATIDAGTEIDLIGSVVSGSNNVTFTVPNSFLTGGSISIESPDTIIECDYPFVMKDAATDFVVSYVNA